MPRPVLFVLAGVNGAGKSSVGGFLLARAGVSWFNPDAYARELRAVTGCDQARANAAAWTEGVRRLDEAVERGRDHAFETTLGGHTITRKLIEASQTHDVLVWFCGLASIELHLERVKFRVACGGHDIPEVKIRERVPLALHHLITLMPVLMNLRVYDNSATVARGETVPDPLLVLEMSNREVTWPIDVRDIARTPQWAKPVVEAALTLSGY